MKILISVLATILISGCSYNVNPEITYSSQGVQRLYQLPTDKQYKTIGIKAWGFYRPGFSQPTLNDVWNEISQKVRDSGGNACVVRNESVGGLSARTIEVTCEVLLVKKK